MEHLEVPTAKCDLDASERKYAAAVALHPHDAALRQQWVRSLTKLGRHEQAQTVLLEGLSVSPNSIQLQVERAKHLIEIGQLTSADAAIQAIAGHHPRELSVLYLRGKLADAVGDIQAAERAYAALVAARPNHIGERLRWIRRLIRLGRMNEAQAALAEGMALAPGTPENFFELQGRLAEAAGDLVAAESDYAMACVAYPQDMGAVRRWVRCLARLARHAEARAAFTKALASMPDCAELMIERANIERKAGELQEAEAAISALSQAFPGHPQLLALRGELAEATGDRETAERLFADDVAANPADHSRRLRWVKCLHTSGRLTEALSQLDESPSPVLNERQLRVELLLELGKWDAARVALDAWPSSGVEQEQLARSKLLMTLAIAQLDHLAAISHARAALKVAPIDSKAATGLARSAVGVFQANVAWRALLRVPMSSPDGGPPRTGTGRLRNLFGQIANDFRLQPEATARLAAAAALSDQALVEEAAAQLCANPDSFGAALGLLTGLNRSNRLAAPVTEIPRVLHQFWDDSVPPPDVARLMTRAAEVNHGCSYRRWSDSAPRAFLSRFEWPDALRAFGAARHVAMRVDIFRLAILYAEGGIYLDADDYCAGPLEALIPRDAEFVCYQEDIGSIGNNFLAAKPRHPIVAAALAEAIQTVLAGASETIWLVTGPGLLTRIIAVAIARDRDLAIPRGVHILPLGELRSVVHPARRVAYKSSRKHWMRAA